MNSLELYNSILNTFIQPNYDNNLRYCSVVVDSIIEEITVGTSSVINSPFICEAIKKVKNKPTTLSYLDAYTILHGTHKKLLNSSYLILDDAYLQDKGYYLFKQIELHNSEEKYKSQIQTLIHLLQKDINEDEFDFSVDLDSVLSKRESSDGSIEDGKTMKSFFNPEIEERIKEEKIKVSQCLDSIQPLLSDSLKEILSLKSDFNDLYTLLIGKKLIALYYSIYENYKYHKVQSRNSTEVNYRNLINNSLSYLGQLEDCFDSLGIDIIVSESGSPFWGKCHETKQTSFNPRNAIIIESILPGFKYGDDIIIKERVKVKGGNS